METKPASPDASALLTALGFERFEGQPLVIACLRNRFELLEPAREALRAELRGLGAALLVLGSDGAWAFHADDPACRLPRAIPEQLLAAVHATYAVDPDAEATLLLLDGADELRHASRLPAGSDVAATLLAALCVAGAELSRAPPSAGRISRRELALGCVAGALAVFADGCRPRSPGSAPAQQRDASDRRREITLQINGAPRTLRVEPRVSLLDALRERLGLTGSKKGCDHGQCGACTVLLDGRRVKSCLVLAVMAEGPAIRTIEGLAAGDALHPMQQAFVDEDALQCGYCTPGQIMSALGLVRENRATNDDELREQMSGNLCRCGAYANIVAAIKRARQSGASP